MAGGQCPRCGMERRKGPACRGYRSGGPGGLMLWHKGEGSSTSSPQVFSRTSRGRAAGPAPLPSVGNFLICH